MLDGSVLETAEKLGNLEKKIEDPRFFVATKAFWRTVMTRSWTM